MVGIDGLIPDFFGLGNNEYRNSPRAMAQAQLQARAQALLGSLDADGMTT